MLAPDDGSCFVMIKEKSLVTDLHLLSKTLPQDSATMSQQLLSPPEKPEYIDLEQAAMKRSPLLSSANWKFILYCLPPAILLRVI